MDHPARPICLVDLAIALKKRYVRSEDNEDLEEILLFEREALCLHPPGHPDRSTSLGNLATSFEHSDTKNLRG